MWSRDTKLETSPKPVKRVQTKLIKGEEQRKAQFGLHPCKNNNLLSKKYFNTFGKTCFNLDDFITLKTFTYPHEVAVVRGKLESEGIECMVQDEMTVQAYPLYSNAVGGIKLKVNAADFERAAEILKDAGYDADEDSPPQPLTQALDEVEEKIAGFIGWRMVSCFIIALAVLTGVIYYFLK